MFNRKKIKQLEKRIIELEKYILGKEITKMVELNKLSELTNDTIQLGKQLRETKMIILKQDSGIIELRNKIGDHEEMIGLVLKHFNLEKETIPSQTKLKEKE